MNKEENNVEENGLAGVDIDDENDSLQDAEFVDCEVKSAKTVDLEKETVTQFFDENNKVVGEKVIEKKTGSVMEIKYGAEGQKKSIMIRDKKKRLRRAVDYHENGVQRLVTDYETNGAYKSTLYNPDGTRVSYVVKHNDKTADAIYYNADGKGNNLVLKLDKNKEVIEKKIVKD